MCHITSPGRIERAGEGPSSVSPLPPSHKTTYRAEAYERQHSTAGAKPAVCHHGSVLLPALCEASGKLPALTNCHPCKMEKIIVAILEGCGEESRTDMCKALSTESWHAGSPQ